MLVYLAGWGGVGWSGVLWGRYAGFGGEVKMLVYLAGGGGVLVGQICGVRGRSVNARRLGGRGRSQVEWSSSGADMRG